MTQKKNELLKELNNKNLKLADANRFFTYSQIFSWDRIINEYSDPFVNDETSQFYDFVDTDQVINLIEFDKNLGSYIMKGILFFENKFKCLIIDKWVEYYQIKDTRIYNYDENELAQLMPNLKKCKDLKQSDFIYSLFSYASNSEFLMDYSSLSEVPIKQLSYSWTFATAINFFRTLDDNIQKEILRQLKIPIELYPHFHKMMNVILKVRNMISHNYVIYNFNSRLYRAEFNRIYSTIKRTNFAQDTPITIDKLCGLIDYLNELSICLDGLSHEIRYLSLNSYSKEYVIKLIYGVI